MHITRRGGERGGRERARNERSNIALEGVSENLSNLSWLLERGGGSMVAMEGGVNCLLFFNCIL